MNIEIPTTMTVVLGLSCALTLLVVFSAGYFFTYGLLLIMGQEASIMTQSLGGLGTLTGALISFFWNQKDYHHHDN